MISPTTKVDRRPELGPVIWQGERETCLPIAATVGHQLLRPADGPLSPEFLFWAAIERGGSPAGLTMSQAASGLVADGQCREDLWPYDPLRVVDVGYGPSAAAKTDALTRLVATHRFYPSPAALDVRTAVQTTTCVLGVALTTSLFITEPNGRIRTPDLTEAPSGGHAMFVAGYDDGEAALLVRNSWGRSWGLDGYGWLPYTYPQSYLWRLWTFEI